MSLCYDLRGIVSFTLVVFILRGEFGALCSAHYAVACLLFVVSPSFRLPRSSSKTCAKHILRARSCAGNELSGDFF